MKIPLLGSIGLSGNTGFMLAAAGIAALYLLHNHFTNNSTSPAASPIKSIVINPSPIGPADIYSNVLASDNLDEDFGVTEDVPLQKIGFTVPLSPASEYGTGTRMQRKDYPEYMLNFDTGYETPRPSTDGLLFLVDKGTSRKVSNPEYAYAARAYDATTTDVTSTSTSTTPATTDPKILDLQNRILRMIVSRTSNVSTVLSNIETIKAEILTYTAKLQLAQQQVDARVINTLQLSQYLTQIAEDIATKLQIQLNPTATDNSVPQYYQQYYQDYQKYLNQLNSNYYDYYQPSYQYYPGQQYDYYQPYQYQYPNPYMSSGQYPTNSPYYQYNQYQSQYPSYGYGQQQYPSYGYGQQQYYGYGQQYPSYGYGQQYYGGGDSSGGGLLGGLFGGSGGISIGGPGGINIG